MTREDVESAVTFILQESVCVVYDDCASYRCFACVNRCVGCMLTHVHDLYCIPDEVPFMFCSNRLGHKKAICTAVLLLVS